MSPKAIRVNIALILSLIVTLALTMPPNAAQAATITVTSTADGIPNAANCPGSNCRLRDAIAAANPSDTISITVTGTITLTGGELLITKNLSIQGPSAPGIAISGNNANRVFEIGLSGTPTVQISDLTIRDGHADGGGGILNYGTLTLNNVTVSGNHVTGPCAVGGGGIFNNGVALTLYNVTISGNTADSGGGAGCPSYGGGISTSGSISVVTVIMNNVTITNNSALTNGRGGGIESDGLSTVYTMNTIIAGNTSGEIGPDCAGSLNSLGYNLIGKNDGCSGLTNAIKGDQVGTGANPINPQLGPLADNGGPTRTHALLLASPAINAGNPASPGSGEDTCLPSDQRGVARPLGAFCDIGAYESPFTSTTTTLLSSANPSVIGQSVTFTATVAAATGTPTGSVDFKDGGTPLGVGALGGGMITFTTSSLSVGSHSIQAVYSGDSSFNSSSSSITQTVNNATLYFPLLMR